MEVGPADLMNLLAAGRDVMEPIFIWGGPGLGKSRITAQFAKQIGFNMRDFRAIYHESVEIRGYPMIDKEKMIVHWLQSADFPRDPDEKVVFFLDEIAQAPKTTQAALLQLLLDRRIGGYVVPKNVWFIAAANRVCDRAGSGHVISPLLDRFMTQFTLVPDAKQWLAWALENSIHPFITSFIRFKNGSLYTYDPDQPSATSFATPRGWGDFVNRILYKVPEEYWGPYIEGKIGEGVAADFASFREVYGEITTMEEIRANPQSARVPDITAMGQLHAVVGMVVDHLIHVEADDINTAARQCLLYLERVPDEYRMMALKDSFNARPPLALCQESQSWIRSNRGSMLELDGIIESIRAGNSNNRKG